MIHLNRDVVFYLIKMLLSYMQPYGKSLSHDMTNFTIVKPMFGYQMPIILWPIHFHSLTFTMRACKLQYKFYITESTKNYFDHIINWPKWCHHINILSYQPFSWASLVKVSLIGVLFFFLPSIFSVPFFFHSEFLDVLLLWIL